MNSLTLGTLACSFQSQKHVYVGSEMMCTDEQRMDLGYNIHSFEIRVEPRLQDHLTSNLSLQYHSLIKGGKENVHQR